MPEIIPNWHPLLVHFPIALVTASALFTLAARFAGDRPLAQQWATVGRWTLWFAAVSALATAAAGWLAFNSVRHDEAGHAAMALHRNWALPVSAGIVLLAAWDGWQARRAAKASWPFTLLLLAAFAGIAVTGWLGGELVYRHGLGVLSLPEAEDESGHGAGHHHDHPGAADEATEHEHGHSH